MAIDQIRSKPYFSGKQQQQRAAKANLDFILKYGDALLKVKDGDKHLKSAEGMNAQTTPFTEPQISYINGIYEKTMKGMGFPSCTVKHDFIKKY